MSGKIFTIDPKHWWDYLNPFWWRRKRVVEAVLNYTWDKHSMTDRMNAAIKNAVLFGKGKLEVDWMEESKKISERQARKEKRK